MSAAARFTSDYDLAALDYRALGNAELGDVAEALAYDAADPFDDFHGHLSAERLRAAQDEQARRARLHAAGYAVPDPNSPAATAWLDLAGDVRRRVDLAAFLEHETGLRFERRGRKREQHGTCHWCGGRERFIVFDPDPGAGKPGRAWCRQCNVSGDVISLYRALRPGLGFRDAVRDIAAGLGLPIPDPQPKQGAPGDMSAAPASPALVAKCDRLQRAYDRMHDRARRYLRRLQTVENLARHPFHQGRTAVVLALAREVAEAPEEDRRPDGAVRARVWRVAKRAGVSEDTVSKAIKSMEKAGVFACDRPKRGQGASSRNETWPRLDLPAARTRDENAVLAYLTQRAPNARRTSDAGNTHGGGDLAGGARKPVCLRCGPSAEVSETVTRQWRCTCCHTLLESRTTEVDRYPNPVAAFGTPYPQVAAIDPVVKTYPQVAAIGDAPTDPDPDPVLAEEPIDFTLFLALPPNGGRVTTPDGPGMLVGKHAAAHRATVKLDACPDAPPFDYRLDEVSAEDIAPVTTRAVGDD